MFSLDLQPKVHAWAHPEGSTIQKSIFTWQWIALYKKRTSLIRDDLPESVDANENYGKPKS